MNERTLVRPEVPLSLPAESYEELDSIRTTHTLHHLELNEQINQDEFPHAITQE